MTDFVTIDFVTVDAGTGTGSGAYGLGATPTTVRQYWCYLRDAELVDHRRPDLHGFPARPGAGLLVDEGGTITLEEDAADLPVTYVSWPGARAYCDWLSERIGARCRLPTAAEWEAAAEGPDGYRWALGPHFVRADYVTSARGPQAVGRGAPNPYGLFDLTGQVFEWTSDGRTLGATPPGAEPATPSRVVKGGSFILRNPENFENGAVFTVDELSCLGCVGFRVLRDGG